MHLRPSTKKVVNSKGVKGPIFDMDNNECE